MLFMCVLVNKYVWGELIVVCVHLCVQIGCVMCVCVHVHMGKGDLVA